MNQILKFNNQNHETTGIKHRRSALGHWFEYIFLEYKAESTANKSKNRSILN